MHVSNSSPSAACASPASQEARTGRQLQQVVPEVPPIPNVPLPAVVTNLLSSLGISLGAPPAQQQSTSLQSAGAPAAAAPAAPAASQQQPQCTATFAEVLGAEPELFFLSSALQLSGFADRLPSPSLGLTIFAPTNPAFLDLLDSLSECLCLCAVMLAITVRLGAPRFCGAARAAS